MISEGKLQKIQMQKELYRPEPVVSSVGEVQQQPSQRTSSPEEVWCNLRSRVLLLDFEHVCIMNAGQLGPRTTRTETNRPVSEDKSTRK